MRARLLATMLMGLGVACATSADPTRRRTDGTKVAEVLASAKTPAAGPVNALGRPLAFLVLRPDGSPSGHPGTHRRVAAVDISTREVLWNAPAEIEGRLAVARTVAVFSRPDGSLNALALTGGSDRWQYRHSSDAQLVGYAADGDSVYVVYRGKKGGTPGSELVGLVAETGSVRFRLALSAQVGAPAARGGIVAVPQRSQFITLIDGQSGQVLVDIISKEEAAKFVRALPEGLFFGSQGVFEASEKTALGSRKSTGYLKATLPDFVHAVYHYDGYQPAQLRYSAVDRNKLLWRVTPRNGVAEFASGMVLVLNFRFLFAVEAESGQLRWAYNHPELDIAGAEHVGRAVVFADSKGNIGALDLANGRTMWKAPAFPGEAVSVEGATFDCDGFYADGPGAEPAQPIVKVLKDIVLDPDRRFADVRLFAVSRLATMRKPGVTAALIEILDKGRDHELVVQTAAESLVELQDPGALDVYVKAIQVRTDYADGTRAQRLDLMARAVAKLGARKVMPELVEHLRLPDTDPSLVRDIADAVIKLKATETLPAFRDYLAQYRADGTFLNRPGGVIAAAEVLAALGGPTDRSLLFFILEEPKTIATLKTAIGRILADLPVVPLEGSASAQP
ncbi:MAG: PQQ-binding-like beta-propeller repeat protein [Deltaproteobacteria bacterium]|nr:PQQ-binding-like beta-propeller repeat protein [Deltaproteobacteria bacterium]